MYQEGVVANGSGEARPLKSPAWRRMTRAGEPVALGGRRFFRLEGTFERKSVGAGRGRPRSVRYDDSQMVSMSSDAVESQFSQVGSAEPRDYFAKQVK